MTWKLWNRHAWRVRESRAGAAREVGWYCRVPRLCLRGHKCSKGDPTDGCSTLKLPTTQYRANCKLSDV